MKAGALYRECAVVNLQIPSPAIDDTADAQVPDDGEFGPLGACTLIMRCGRMWENVDLQGDKKAGIFVRYLKQLDLVC